MPSRGTGNDGSGVTSVATRDWHCAGRVLGLSQRVHIMGVLNVTPDSFSDGGLYLDPARAVERARVMLAEGADIIDVGGESTRPGAGWVAVDEELRRVLPVVEAVASQASAVVSIDTTKAQVARAALQAGAVIVNDVSALRFDPEMTPTVCSSGAGVVLMHMLGTPRTMQQDPTYSDVVGEVGASLLEWAQAAERAGVAAEQIVLDPGIGFGKTREHNLSLIKGVSVLRRAGYPVLIGASRKSFIGTTLGAPVGQRLEGTAAAVACSVMGGAAIVRVHDVRQMAQVVRMVEAILSAP